MKLVAKTLDKIILEVTETEIRNYSFDFIWDKVRDVYNKEKFNIFSIYTIENDEFDYPVEKVVFIELTHIKEDASEKVLI